MSTTVVVVPLLFRSEIHGAGGHHLQFVLATVPSILVTTITLVRKPLRRPHHRRHRPPIPSDLNTPFSPPSMSPSIMNSSTSADHDLHRLSLPLSSTSHAGRCIVVLMYFHVFFFAEKIDWREERWW
ncbi:transmembrane protein, putative [Medicago truncatula]|uniref:Transmembrane protein, putative n=1 Tax=Medicago truncatula TaxID=3880 RepID=G7KNX0_MEDTR|nr:transmembrane protein, putative [Medicago truncatula]